MNMKIVAALILIAAAGCVPSAGGGQPAPNEYRTPIAKARSNGLTVYWIGEAYAVGGRHFRRLAAKYPEGIAGAPISSLELVYLSDDENELYGLEIKSISSSEWRRVESEVREPRNVPNVRRAQYQVAGRPAEMIWAPSPNGEPSGRVLIVEFDDSVVVASVSAETSLDGSPTNPLIDPQLFVQYMQMIRPYPE
jgi:hypothetical protein